MDKCRGLFPSLVVVELEQLVSETSLFVLHAGDSFCHLI